MPRFNPEEYSTVSERKEMFLRDFGDCESITVDTEIITPPEKLSEECCVRVTIEVKSAEKQMHRRGQGVAYEKAGWAGADKTSWVENAETSAWGRALAAIGYEGSKSCSREEIYKVERAEKKPEKRRELAEGNAVVEMAKDVLGVEKVKVVDSSEDEDAGKDPEWAKVNRAFHAKLKKLNVSPKATWLKGMLLDKFGVVSKTKLTPENYREFIKKLDVYSELNDYDRKNGEKKYHKILQEAGYA